MSIRTRISGALAVATIALLVTALLAAAQRSESPEILYQRGLDKEVTDADFTAAIDFYKKVVEAQGVGRGLAAQALLRMAQCYERQNNNAEAQKAYERIVREYSGEVTVAGEARARLKELLTRTPANSSAGPRLVFTTPNQNYWQWGAVTPDGRYLVGFRNEYPEKLVLADLTRPDVPVIIDSLIAQMAVLALSSDGKHVAVREHQLANSYRLRTGIGAFPGNGEPLVTAELFRSTQEQLFGADGPFRSAIPFGWSADGGEVFALFARKDETFQIGAAATSTGAFRSVQLLDWRCPDKLSVSPDGRYVAYDAPVSRGSANRDIFLVPANGGSAATLAPDPARDALPLWTPDGKAVVFTSDRSGKTGLWMVPVAEGKAAGPVRPLRPEIGPVWPIGFTRDGALFYQTGEVRYIKRGFTTKNVQPMEIAIGEISSDGAVAAVKTMAPSGGVQNPAFSPDGKQLAYFSRGNGFFKQSSVDGDTALESRALLTLVVRALESGSERRIPTAFTWADNLTWFPDGQSVAFIGQSDDLSGDSIFDSLHRIDLNTGQDTIRTTVRTAQGAQLLVSSNGRKIYSVTYGPYSSPLMVYDVETQRQDAVPIASNPGNNVYLSPDGRKIYYLALYTVGAGRGRSTDYSMSAVMVYDLETARESEVFRISGDDKQTRSLSFALSPDGSQLALRRQYETASGTAGPEAVSVFVTSAFGGPVKQLPVSVSGDARASVDFFQWSADGKSLLLTNFIGEFLRVSLDGGIRRSTIGPNTRIVSLQPHGNQIAIERPTSPAEPWRVWADPTILSGAQR